MQRKAVIVLASLALAACSHIPFMPKRAAVVGVVEYDTGIARYSTVTGVYHQATCSKAIADATVHLPDKALKAIFAQADRSGFYEAPSDLTTDWQDPANRPPHCATFMLHLARNGRDRTVRWDCGRDGSNAPPPQVADVFLLVQDSVQREPAVRALPWSHCGR